MPFHGIYCPTCGGESLRRKRHTAIRYQEVLNETGLRVGEYRYYQIHCSHCLNSFYLQEKTLYEKPGMASQKHLVTDTVYQGAPLYRPGLEYIGSTASEYSRRISRGADRKHHTSSKI